MQAIRSPSDPLRGPALLARPLCYCARCRLPSSLRNPNASAFDTAAAAGGARKAASDDFDASLLGGTYKAVLYMNSDLGTACMGLARGGGGIASTDGCLPAAGARRAAPRCVA